MSVATPSRYVQTPHVYQYLILIMSIAQTALLIGEKCAVLSAEDLGYSGAALDMKIPPYHAPGENVGLARL